MGGTLLPFQHFGGRRRRIEFKTSLSHVVQETQGCVAVCVAHIPGMCARLGMVSSAIEKKGERKGILKSHRAKACEISIP